MASGKTINEGKQRILWIAIAGLVVAGGLYLLFGRSASGPPNAGAGKYYYTGKMVPHGMAARQEQGPP
jgi:hypothetical protein